ncbi:hypothetical protein OQA88_9155 [Cercophora sp. LCS_1]
MSGFEVAGVVLGTLPLVIEAVKAYIGFMKDWGKVASELRSINRQLTTERSRFYNVCEQLLSDVVPQNDIEPMLQDPFGPLWQAENTNKRIRRRLWNSYEPFETTVMEVQEALRTIQEKLSVDVTRDGHVKWVDKRRMPREFRKFLYRLDRKDHQDALGTISKCVNDLESLTRLSVALEPGRRKRSGGRVIGLLRDLSSSVYRALRASVLCGDSHDVSLGLSSPFANIGYEEDEDKVLSDTRFRVAISFESDNPVPESKKLWDELDIQRHPAVIAKSSPATPSYSPQTTGPKRARVVAFAKSHSWTMLMTSAKSSIMLEKPRKDIKVSVTSVTQHLQVSSQDTDATLVSQPGSLTETPATALPLDICTTLKKTSNTRPNCYGHLIDSTCSTHHFRVCSLASTSSGNNWTIITLDDVLNQRQGLQPLLWLQEKVCLAYEVASAVLQLNKTPWLPEPLTKKDVHFFSGGAWQGYQQAYLQRQMPGPTLSNCTTNNSAEETLVYKKTLFSLGVLLLEIILGSSLESLRKPEESVEFPGDELGVIRDSITIHRLLQTQVALINPAYKTVIERCVGCGLPQGLDEETFREKMYNGVVTELEAILEHTKL